MNGERAGAEAGFTLVELLAAIAVLGVISVALSTAVLVTYRTLDQTSLRVAGSTDAQFVSIYLPSDIASADSATDSVTTPGLACIGATNIKLQLTSAINLGALTAGVVIYWVDPVGKSFQLVRSVCVNGSVGSRLVVARNLLDANSAVAAAIDRGYALTVTEKVASAGAVPSYQFRISGRFRKGITT